MTKGVSPVLDSFPNDRAFVNKMVGELNACKKSSRDEFAYMRKMVVDLIESIVVLPSLHTHIQGTKHCQRWNNTRGWFQKSMELCMLWRQQQRC